MPTRLARQEEKKYNYLIKSVIRAIDILEEMSRAKQAIRITELSEIIGVSKSTIHRFLSTLEYKGFVEQEDESGKYRLSLKLFELGNSILHSLDLHSRSFPVLQELNKKVGETIHLVIYDKGDAVFINKVVSDPTMVTYSYIGKRCHAHCIASGKVLMAHLSRDDLQRVIAEKGLPKHTPQTISDPEILKEQLAKILHDGLGYCFEEYLPGINGVAAPIRNHLGQVVAAVSVSGSSIVLNADDIASFYAKEIKEAALKISRNMGYNENILK